MEVILSKFSKLLEESKSNQMIRVINGNTKLAKEYLNWLKYEPKHWNIGGLLNKSSDELDSEEKTILKLRQKELELIPIFESYINSECIEYSKIGYDFIKSMSISSYAKLKLTEQELQDCNDKLQEMIYSNNDTNISPEEKIKSLINSLKPDISVVDSYMKFMLEIRLQNIKRTKSFACNTKRKLVLKNRNSN